MMNVQAGQEYALLDRLLIKNPNALYSKILGKYDILEFSQLDSIHEVNKVNTDPFILGTTNFPCFFWQDNHVHFWDKLSASPIASLISLKLNDTVKYLTGLRGLTRVLGYLNEKYKGYLFSLSGLGHYEIILWHLSDNFENIFSLLREIRHLTVEHVFSRTNKKYKNHGVFLDTTTIPTISFANVILKKNWHLLKGDVRPVTRAQCLPFYELEIAAGLLTKARDILGEDDLMFMWDKPVKLKKFIPQLLKYRSDWKDNMSLRDTNTCLLSLKYLPKPNGGNFKYEPDQPDYYTEKLEEVAQMQGVNQYLINELQCIVSLINSFIARRSSSRTFSDVLASIDFLNLLLDEYVVCLQSHTILDKAEMEAKLLLFTESMRIALSQRFPGIEISGTEITGPPLTTYSVSRVIRAASIIIEYIFSVITKTNPPQKYIDKVAEEEHDNIPEDKRNFYIEDFREPWKGFLYLDFTEGYQEYEGEIFSMPLVDIFRPLNWITLSHEICHMYYERIYFQNLEMNFLKTLESELREADSLSLKLYEENLNNMVWELFSNWFDYKHFYAEDLEFYIWNIWRTWFGVPRVFQFTKEYLTRTIFIMLCKKWNDINTEITRINEQYEGDDEKKKTETTRIFEIQLNELSEFLQKHFPAEFKSILPGINEDTRQKICGLLFYYYHLIHVFEASYVNHDLQEALNKNYKRLDDHVIAILNGEVIPENISNPFILIREILKKIYNKEFNKDLPTESVIALIYSLWGIIQIR